MEAKTVYAQCQCCGHIGKTRLHNYNIEEIYIDEYECPRCNGEIGLNCGEDKSDIYLYMNPNVDPNYFNYD